MPSAVAFNKFFDYFKLAPSFLGRFFDLKANLNLNSGNLFIGLLLVAVLLYGLSLGRTRAVISLLSIYVAFVIYEVFPYFNEVKNIIKIPVDDYIIHLGIFLTVYAVVFVVFNYSFVSKRFSSADFSLFSVFLLSFLQFGLLASIVISFLPSDVGLKFLGPAYSFLASDKALFCWSIIPVPVILLFAR